jgi:excinuclease UvrABC nuclease subunit
VDEGTASEDERSQNAVRQAGVEEIAATPGFTRSLAEKVLETI